MERRYNNKQLFFKGFVSKLEKALGFFIILISFVGIVFNYYWAIGFLVGGLIYYHGASNEYDYKRRGGYIIYND